jgi:hypothetical protein
MFMPITQLMDIETVIILSIMPSSTSQSLVQFSELEVLTAEDRVQVELIMTNFKMETITQASLEEGRTK